MTAIHQPQTVELAQKSTAMELRLQVAAERAKHLAKYYKAKQELLGKGSLREKEAIPR